MASAKSYVEMAWTWFLDTCSKWVLETLGILSAIVAFVVIYLDTDTECSAECSEECRHKDSSALTSATITLVTTSTFMLISILKNIFVDRAAAKRAKEAEDAADKRAEDAAKRGEDMESRLTMAIADAGLAGSINAPAHLNDGLNGTSFHALYHTRNRPPANP